MKRHRDALSIVNPGACNPSGIAHTIVETCREIMQGKEYGGTATVASDPALRLMIHQLAYICRVGDLDDIAEYSKCLDECTKRAAEKPGISPIDGQYFKE